MKKSCLLLDSSVQEIVEQRGEDQEYIEIDHDQKWHLRIPLKEINQIKADHTIRSIISPFSFLYLLSKEHPKEHCLWGAILEEHIFLVVFHDSRPLFFRIYKRDERVLKDCVEDFMREFYESKESFFIEEIVLCYEPKHFEVDPTIAQELLVPVEFKEIDYEEICNNDKIPSYRISDLITDQKHESTQVEIGINKRFVFGVGLFVLLFLIGYDLYLRFETKSYEDKIKNLLSSQVRLANENNSFSSEMLKISMIEPFISSLLNNNESINERIRSTFDLIPEDTYLTKFILDKNNLVITGVSKKRESFIKNIDKKLSQSYEKHRFKIKKVKDGFLFEAFYEEREQ